ncbi:MAG: GNAT family N-acetyltransferase [Acidimicrobiaceae bacterium]|nr:GNAT family N-acetyltransferase [Acidimicrobiaceae bacterium]
MTSGAASASSTAPMVLPVPDLAGPTTCLRPWRVTDAPALVAAWHDPEIRKRLKVPEPADEAFAVRWISQRERAWTEGRSADLAVTDPPSGTVIGEVGLSGLDPVRRAALVGWWIAKDWRGRGRASEAVRLVVDWALSEGPLEAVMAEIGADNPASAAVARRAGLRRVDASRHVARESSDVTLLVFARTRAGAGPP